MRSLYPPRPVLWLSQLALTLALALAPLMVGCSPSRGAATPEVLAERVMEAVARDDFEAYAAFVLQPSDREEVVRRWAGGGAGAPGDGERFDAYQALRWERQRHDFGELRRRAAGAGLVWSDVEISGLDAINQSKSAATVTDIHVSLRHGGVDYRVKLDDCMRLGRGWVVLDGIRWEVDRGGP